MHDPIKLYGMNLGYNEKLTLLAVQCPAHSYNVPPKRYKTHSRYGNHSLQIP